MADNWKQNNIRVQYPDRWAKEATTNAVPVGGYLPTIAHRLQHSPDEDSIEGAEAMLNGRRIGVPISTLVSFSPVYTITKSGNSKIWNPDCNTAHCVTLQLPLIKGSQVLQVFYYVYGFITNNQNSWFEVPPNWDLEWAIFEAVPEPVETDTATVVEAIFKNWSSGNDRLAYIGAQYKIPR